MSRKIWQKTVFRVIIWLGISSMILFCSIVGLSECLDRSVFTGWRNRNSSVTTTNKSAGFNMSEDDLSCGYPWFYTFCAALAMTSTSVFLRIHFLMKLALNCVSLAAFWYIIDVRGEEVFRQQTAKLADWEEFGRPTDQSHCYYLCFVLLMLHTLDRQVEYVCRLDYLLKQKLKSEREEAHTMELVSRTLLHNIVPQHVAQYYLDKQQEDDGQSSHDCYHEERSSVAVMFASIPNFSNFYYEDRQNEEGLRCIQLLNEIICDFDLLLYERGFADVEKIKTIGSTYMAACGLHCETKKQLRSKLHVERNSVVEHQETRLSEELEEEEEQEQAQANVSTLVKFAVALMSSLQELNKDAMQDFQLRVGIAVGPLMAGVVGTVKPQYDIWGDTVNLASRMDSTGIPGRIQVSKEVADVLSTSNSLYKCKCRGDIFVKGKGMLTTFLIQTPFDDPHFETTSF